MTTKRPVRVYVAAPFTEWAIVREVQAELRSRGAEITEDWTAGIESLPVGMTDGDVSEEIARESAWADARGVALADAILLLTHPDKSRGCGMWVEMGIAIGARWGRILESVAASFANMDSDVDTNRPRIAVCGPQRDRTIFSRLGKRFADWREALPYVLGETT